MGADIHFVVEKRVQVTHDVKKWVGVLSTDEDISYLDWAAREAHPIWRHKGRNYNAFTRLAGIRGRGPDPQGIPVDASELALSAIYAWDSDGHSHSYLPLETFVLRCLGEDAMTAAVAAKMTDKLTAAALELSKIGIPKPELDDYRVVFWFDN